MGNRENGTAYGEKNVTDDGRTDRHRTNIEFRDRLHNSPPSGGNYTRRARVAPKGTFCVENTLNIYHPTYDDVIIQNPSIIDLAWKLKILLYQDVTNLIIFDHF